MWICLPTLCPQDKDNHLHQIIKPEHPLWAVKWILETCDPCNIINSKTQKCVCKATLESRHHSSKRNPDSLCWSLDTCIMPKNLKWFNCSASLWRMSWKKAQNAQDYNCRDLMNWETIFSCNNWLSCTSIITGNPQIMSVMGHAHHGHKLWWL